MMARTLGLGILAVRYVRAWMCYEVSVYLSLSIKCRQ